MNKSQLIEALSKEENLTLKKAEMVVNTPKSLSIAAALHPELVLARPLPKPGGFGGRLGEGFRAIGHGWTLW